MALKIEPFKLTQRPPSTQENKKNAVISAGLQVIFKPVRVVLKDQRRTSNVKRWYGRKKAQKAQKQNFRACNFILQINTVLGTTIALKRGIGGCINGAFFNLGIEGC